MLKEITDNATDFDFSDDPEIAWTLPGYTYHDSRWFELEKRKIFGSSWRFVGHITDIANPGDYLTNTIVDQPVVVLRDRQDQIKAFHNVCKHRAHLLFTEDFGTMASPLITCPYHAWAYDTEGNLQAAPHCDLIREFDKSGIKLDSVKVEVFNGLIFVNLDPNAKPLHPQLDDIFPRIRAHYPDLENYKRSKVIVFDIKANWKNVGDNGLECYHCHTAHKAFVDLVDMDTYKVETGKAWSWQSGTCRPENVAYNMAHGLSDFEREFITMFVWPDTFLVKFAGADSFATFIFEAVTPELTHQKFTFYSPDGEMDQVCQEIHDYFANVLGPEDVNLVETVQKGLHSQSYDRGRFMIDPDRSFFSEHAVHHFHSLVQRHMKS
jgi:phenylpropionate dioxygenase-like ring-hydroxylating dioxygenase large terminal subunit